MAGAADPMLDRARSATIAFCRYFGFTPEQLAQIEAEPPLLGPVAFERDGSTFTAYRWLGSGRGADYVQADVEPESGRIVVHGAHRGSGLGPRDAVGPPCPQAGGTSAPSR